MRRTNPKFACFLGLPESSAPSLYVASAGTLTKVGMTTQPRTRAKALLLVLEQMSGVPMDGFCFFEGAGNNDEELAMLRLMRSRFPSAAKQEYFTCSFEQALPIVHGFCQRSLPHAVAVASAKIRRDRESLEIAIEQMEKRLDHLTKLRIPEQPINIMKP